MSSNISEQSIEGNIIKLRNRTLAKKWVPCFFEEILKKF